MRAVVTGAGGFVGSHLTEHLLEAGHEVLAVDRALGPVAATWDRHPGVKVSTGDIRDPMFVDSAIDASVDVVFHLAAIVGVHNYLANPFDVIDVNVIGTRNVLMSASETDTKVVLTSTSEIYGKNPLVPWDEDDDRVLGSTSVDRWSYSTSKASCEHLAYAIHRQRGLPVSIVRYFNAYGPRQAPIYVVSRAIHRVLNGRRPVLYDGGEQTRCFTYVRDIVAGTMAAAAEEEANGEVFNLGSPVETTVREVIEIVLREAGADFGWEELSTEAEIGPSYEDIDRRVPSVSKAEKVLGWRATTDLVDGISSTIQWARDHPSWLGDISTLESAPTMRESGA